MVLQEPLGLIHRYGQPEVTEHRHLVQAGRRGRSQLGFDRVKALHDEGKTLAQIARETGFNWRTVRKWTRLDAFRPQATMAPKPTPPGSFGPGATSVRGYEPVIEPTILTDHYLG